MVRRIGLACGALAGGLVVLAWPAGAQPPAGTDYGFVMTRLGAAFYRGDEKVDCPDGRSHSLREAYMATQSPAERERLVRPENAKELERKYKIDYVFGPGGRDICTNPAAFDTPSRELQKTVQSKIGPGMNLDGAAPGGAPAPGTCAHDKFTGPAGEAGVDNQFFRSIGCNTFWRGASTGVGDGLGEFPWTDKPVVVVVRHVKSWENDPDVEVEIAASPDKAAVGGGKILPGASYSMTDNPHWRVVLKARIENGVVITEPGDLAVPVNWVGATNGEYLLNKARFRFRRQADGGLQGQAGGYRPIDNAIAVLETGGPGVASAAGVECASVRKTLRVMADGDRDPKTGQCASVSTGLEFAAAPAFVFEHGVLVAGPQKAAKPQQKAGF